MNIAAKEAGVCKNLKSMSKFLIILDQPFWRSTDLFVANLFVHFFHSTSRHIAPLYLLCSLATVIVSD